MKRLTYLIFCLSLICSPLAANAKDTVGNGEGLAEQHVMYAFSNFHVFLDLCLSMPGRCRINAGEMALARSIQASLPREATTKIEFISGKEKPGFFVINGETKVAKTGDQVGDSIYVNTDLLAEADQEGLFHVMTVAEAVALVTHELGHHQNVHDEVLLDSLAVKVQAMLMAHMQRAEQGLLAPRFYAGVVNFQRWDLDAKLWVTDGQDLESLEPYVRSYVKCPQGTQIAGTRVENLHWQQAPVRLSKTPNLWKIEVRGLVIGFCKIGSKFAGESPRAPMGISLLLSQDETGKRSYIKGSAVAGPGNWN